MAKKRNNQTDSENSVPLYSSYGVTKKEGFFVKFNNVFAAVLAVILLALLAVVWVMGIYILTAMLGAIGVMILITAALLFFYIKLCRKLRKRAKFIFRLNRLCKQMGYRLKFHRGFFKGLRLNKEGLDFTVNTGKKIWDVRFFTPKKYLSHLIFVDNKTVEVKTNITKSRLKFILGFDHPKLQRMDYTFNDKITEYGKNNAKALIINPVSHDVFKKDTDGAVIPIGTGERLYGYTIFTASGFIETLRREDDR